MTGAAGFVGRALAGRLADWTQLSLGSDGWRDTIRSAPFRGRVVVHLAARVPGPRAAAEQYEQDNVEKTVQLAKAAVDGGAERFVLLSTVKVHGEESGAEPVRVDSPIAPADAYARSKWQAEQSLRDIANRAGLPWVVIRPPLVYGHGARGNFQAFLRLANSPVWLPFASICNRRSLLHVHDLADLLLLALEAPGAAGKTYLAAHPEAVSTPRLFAAARLALGRPARLFRAPPRLLERAAGAVGAGRHVRRLTRSLEIDASPLRRELDWVPAHDLEAGLREALG